MKKKWTLEQLRFTEANRDVVRQHVDKIKESIKSNGYLTGIPILVDSDGFILDGQHRAQACKELQVEPTIIECGNFDLVPHINSLQLKWRTADYIKYYATKGYEHYIILDQLCKSKKISPSVAYAVIYEKGNRVLSGVNNKISPLRDGSFKIPDTSEKGLKKLERRIDNILDLITEMGLPKTDRLVVALARIANNPNFVFSIMKKKIEFQRSKIHRCTTIQEYSELIATIYNYKNVKKVAV